MQRGALTSLGIVELYHPFCLLVLQAWNDVVLVLSNHTTLGDAGITSALMRDYNTTAAISRLSGAHDYRIDRARASTLRYDFWHV